MTATIRGLGVTAYACHPLIASGRLLGTLSFGSRTRAHFEPEEVALMASISDQLAVALDRARLMEELQKQSDELRAANAAKDEFLGLMSHALRTPTTTLFGGAKILKREALRMAEEDRSLLLEDLERESERLLRMIENLLVLARLEARRNMNTEPLLIQREVPRIVDAFASARPDREIKIEVEDQIGLVLADPTGLELVLRNLLSNSHKYSPAGEAIHVNAREEDGQAIVSVCDFGDGVQESELEQIFESFYRSEETRTIAGLGLGLAVCKRLVEAQDGRIWASRQSGFEVSFALPLMARPDSEP